MIKEYLHYLCCPICQKPVTLKKSFLLCNHCYATYPISHGIPDFIAGLDNEARLSESKWSQIYQESIKRDKSLKEYKYYLDNHADKNFQDLNSVKRINNIIYLEIGCGPFHIGTGIAKSCKLIIGVDFSLPALLTAKKNLDKLGVKNYLLLRADVRELPVANNRVDLIYGGGVIEHFRNTQNCVSGLYRILKKGGVSINTVPLLNLASLTYRQIWGNIPNLPLIQQLAEFIHIKILRGRHMIFGYELSFTSGKLKSLHQKAGFKKIKVERLIVDLYFEFIPQRIRWPLIWLAENSILFWPMVKVIAYK